MSPYFAARFWTSNWPDCLTAMQKLKEEPQMLFLRLFLRSGPWFKLNGLSFSECKDILAAALELEEAGLAENLGRIAQMQRKDAVKCMTVLEIQSVLAALDLQPKKDAKSRPPVKAQLVEILANALDSRNQVQYSIAILLDFWRSLQWYNITIEQHSKTCRVTLLIYIL